MKPPLREKILSRLESAGQELAERGGTMTATAKITKRSTMQAVLRARRRLAETA